MKTVNPSELQAKLEALLDEVEQGEEVVIERDGEPVAKLTRIEQSQRRPEPGAWRKYPGWENFQYDASIFAPMTEEEMREEGWPVD
jgi:prevent-host-death family protein